MKLGETKIGFSRPVLIHLPLEMLRQLDAAADLFGMYRAEVVRRSLKRELSTVLGEEIQRMHRVVSRKMGRAEGSAQDRKRSRGRRRWFRSWVAN